MEEFRIFKEYLHEKQEGFIFIGHIGKDGKYVQKAFPSNSVDQIEKYISDLGNVDIYITPNSFANNTNRKSHNAIQSAVLFADYDCPADYRKTSNQPYETIEKTIANVTKYLGDLGIFPTIIITGNGIQIFVKLHENLAKLNDVEYSALSEALFQAGLSPEKRRRFYNEAKDKAKIVRLPGTTNTKAKAVAGIHTISEQILSLKEIKKTLNPLLQVVGDKPILEKNKLVQPVELSPEFIEWTNSPELLKYNSDAAYPSSSEKEMAIQGHLYRQGITTLEQHMEIFKEHLPKSSHFWQYSNDKDRKAYLDRGLRKICQNAKTNQGYEWFNSSSKKIDVNKLAAWFDQNRGIFLDDFRLFDQTLRMWDGCKWVVSSDSTLEKYFFSYFQERGLALRRNHIRELCSSFKLYEFNHVRIEDCDLDYTKKIAIAFSNGTLYINPEKMEHDFKKNYWDKLDYSLYQVQHEYDDDLMTLDWHDTMVGEHLREFYTENGIEAIQLFFASILIPQFDLQKCLYILGDGCNGKGMITRTFSSLFSNGSVTSLNVSKWGATHENIVLKDSVMNISNEIQNRGLSADLFKAVVACDYITFNPKYEVPFQAKLFAKHIFTANKLPNTKVDKALARRLLFVKTVNSVPMNQQSSQYEINYKKNGKRVWLAIALQGIYKLIKLDFRINAGDQSCKLDWMEENDGLFEFIQTTFVRGKPEDFISTDEIYTLYLRWRDSNKMNDVMRNMTKNKMSSRLGDILAALEWQCINDRGSVNNKQVRGWYGLKLKPRKSDLEVVSSNL